MLFKLSSVLLLLATSIFAAPVPSGFSESEADVVLENRAQGGAASHSGKITYYYPGLGSCGFTDNNNSPVVAVSAAIMQKSNCNQYVQITNSKGKSTYGQVRDTCPGCGSSDLDISPIVFKKLAALDDGVAKVKWHFMPKGWKP